MKAFDWLRRRASAYRRTFDGPVAEVVLADLAKFCRANTSTFHPDSRAHAVAEGRREVWLRIQTHLQMSDDELWALLGREHVKAKEVGNE